MLFELTKFQPENYLTFYDNLEFCIRILLSCALGFMIGYERPTRIKGAGSVPIASSRARQPVS